MFEEMSGIERDEDFRFLHGLLKDRRLHLLLKVHERLRLFEDRRPVPVQADTQALLCDLLEKLQASEDPDTTELLRLLSRPHVKALLSVLETVSQKDYAPRLPPLPACSGEEEDSVKIVSLVKSQEPLGATIRRSDSTGAIVVARIMRGGAADKSGLIHEGDELREVNGISLEDKQPEEVVPILAQSQGAVTFKVIPGSQEGLSANENKVFVRCLFDYEPLGDPAIPCREAGLAFKKGDILEILSQQDDNWWQARRHANGNSRAGLIPSRQLQQRRVALQRPLALFQPHRLHTHSGPEGHRGKVKVEVTALAKGHVCLSRRVQLPGEEDADYRAITGIHIAGLRRSFRLSRKAGQSQAGRTSRDPGTQTKDAQDAQDTQAQTPTYLEVVPYLKAPHDPHRLVLLVGPSGVGVSELKRRILISDPERYSVTVPHTTRKRRSQERDGVDYHFVSRETFEKAILDHRFIEYGQHKGNYYGLSVSSVHQVLVMGKVCLLDVQPQTILRLYTAEQKPFVVFVKPPALEELRLTRRRAKLLSDLDTPRTFSEEDFQDMIGSAVTMETQYGHLFEKVVVNGDVAMAFTELRVELGKMGKENQWIPVGWNRT
ncbi:MAGUK p55 subfamily member 7-like [Osmerus eperlanus]|uniref:MAGUK p55 subfamily member 7-like n=1 Tax=Osmerus eperlanus TaxID=29151 RepID=UPI002E149175